MSRSLLGHLVSTRFRPPIHVISTVPGQHLHSDLSRRPLLWGPVSFRLRSPTCTSSSTHRLQDLTRHQPVTGSGPTFQWVPTGETCTPTLSRGGLYVCVFVVSTRHFVLVLFRVYRVIFVLIFGEVPPGSVRRKSRKEQWLKG